MKIPPFTNPKQSNGVPPGNAGDGRAKRFWDAVMHLRGVVAAMTLVSFLVEFGGVDKIKAIEAIRAFSLLWHGTFVWFSSIIENLLQYFSIEYSIPPSAIKVISATVVLATPIYLRGENIDGVFFNIVDRFRKKYHKLLLIIMATSFYSILIDKYFFQIITYKIYIIIGITGSLCAITICFYSMLYNKQLLNGYRDIFVFFFVIEVLYFAEVTSFNDWIDAILESRQAAIAQEGGL